MCAVSGFWQTYQACCKHCVQILPVYLIPSGTWSQSHNLTQGLARNSRANVNTVLCQCHIVSHIGTKLYLYLSHWYFTVPISLTLVLSCPISFTLVLSCTYISHIGTSLYPCRSHWYFTVPIPLTLVPYCTYISHIGTKLYLYISHWY